LATTLPRVEDLSLSYTLFQKYFSFTVSGEEASGVDDPGLMQTLGTHQHAVI